MPGRGVGENQLAPAVEFDGENARNRIESVRPGMQDIPCLSAQTGGGLVEPLDLRSDPWVPPRGRRPLSTSRPELSRAEPRPMQEVCARHR